MRPVVQTKDSAGADLYAAEDGFVVPGGTAVVSTGYLYDVDKPALVKGRSGLAFKYKVLAFEGLIDADYREEIKVLLYNLSPAGTEAFRWRAGERIAQLVILDNVRTAEHYETKPTEREGGFGSTDKQHSAFVSDGPKYWTKEETVNGNV